MESKFNERSRNEDVRHFTTSSAHGLGIFSSRGDDAHNGKVKKLDAETLKKAHQYVLFNCEEVKPYIE